MLVDAELTDTAILATLGRMELGREKFKPSEWRIEVFTNRNGRRYWNYRRRGKRGGKENYSYGGTFETLTDELRDAYRKRPKAQG